MIGDVNTQQRQIQEQKTTIKGAAYGHWIGEVIKWGLFVTACLVMIGVLLWIFDGIVGMAIDLSVLVIGVLVGLWFLWNWSYRQYYKTKQVEFGTHFYAHQGMIVGDWTTREYRLFYIPNLEQVKDEPVTVEGYPQDTYEQIGDRSIHEMKREGKTWDEIVKSFDPALGMTLQKARSAVKRHEDRVRRGETYE